MDTEYRVYSLELLTITLHIGSLTILLLDFSKQWLENET